MDDCAESGFTLYDDVWDAHLPAQSREEDDKLDRIDVVGDDDEGCLLGLDESDTVVETVLDEEWLLGVLRRYVSLQDINLDQGGAHLLLLVISGFLGLGLETGLFVLLGLGAVSIT